MNGRQRNFKGTGNRPLVIVGPFSYLPDRRGRKSPNLATSPAGVGTPLVGEDRSALVCCVTVQLSRQSGQMRCRFASAPHDVRCAPQELRSTRGGRAGSVLCGPRRGGDGRFEWTGSSLRARPYPIRGPGRRRGPAAFVRFDRHGRSSPGIRPYDPARVGRRCAFVFRAMLIDSTSRSARNSKYWFLVATATGARSISCRREPSRSPHSARQYAAKKPRRNSTWESPVALSRRPVRQQDGAGSDD